jgi:hypothetical protein
MVRLLYPARANKLALAATGDFFRLLGMDVQVEADADLPMLIKNLAPAAG